MDKKITRPRRRASRLLARLLGADLVSGTYLEFVKMHAGYLLFTNMKSLFTNTLLIRVTGDNSLVMKFNLMQFICIPFAYTLGAFYIRRRSLPRAAAWGMGFSALFYAVFFLSLNHLVWMLPLLSVITAISFGFYTLANQTMTLEYSADENREAAISISGVVSGVISMAMPVINGAIISALPGLGGYYAVFGVSMVIAFFVVRQTRKLPDRRIPGQIHFRETVRDALHSRPFLLAGLAETFKGVREGVFTFFLNVLLFECIQSEFLVGVNTLLVGIVSIFGCWLLGRLVRPHNRIRYMFAALASLLCVTCILLLRLDAFTVMLMSVCNSFFTCFTLNPSSSMQFYVVSKLPESQERRSEYLALKAYFLAIGRVAGVIIVSSMPGTAQGSVLGMLAITLLQFGTPILYHFAVKEASLLPSQETQ